MIEYAAITALCMMSLTAKGGKLIVKTPLKSRIDFTSDLPCNAISLSQGGCVIMVQSMMYEYNTFAGWQEQCLDKVGIKIWTNHGLSIILLVSLGSN